ncbi:hypothetical protein CCHR01_01942 [Colletotrichum chrysophilum]|uniref:Secreted protein n=1 Tax=Colletotrichum chrysophilum TaxID=1836956 RepID=A0AAD9B184_9PEZI|nr:hypothetical protein CCHR01_01942 [Colletotrichum chrysophilum]
MKVTSLVSFLAVTVAMALSANGDRLSCNANGASNCVSPASYSGRDRCIPDVSTSRNVTGDWVAWSVVAWVIWTSQKVTSDGDYIDNHLSPVQFTTGKEYLFSGIDADGPPSYVIAGVIQTQPSLSANSARGQCPYRDLCYPSLAFAKLSAYKRYVKVWAFFCMDGATSSLPT